MTKYLSREVIEDRAESIRIQAGLVSAPIRPEKVASYLGITVEYELFSDDLSGVLIRKGQKSVIAVNRKHSATRQAFTLAHEVGHHFLEHTGDLFVDKVSINKRDRSSSLAIEPQEIQANQFAASLLMPRPLLIQQLEKTAVQTTDRDELVAILAKKFGVSTKAMEYRLVNLALLSTPDD